MNDIRRTILLAVFAFSLVMLWDQWQIYNGRQATFFPRPDTSAQVVDAESSPTEPAHQQADELDVPEASSSGSGQGTEIAEIVSSPAEPTAREQITASNDVLELTFDTLGGSIVKSEFKHFDTLKEPREQLVLLNTAGDKIYQAQSGLIGGDFPNHRTPMVFSGQRELGADENHLVLRFASAMENGVQLIKTYTLERGSYVVGLRVDVINDSGAAIDPQLYLQFIRDDSKIAGGTPFYSTFNGPAFYTSEKKFQKVSFKDIDKGKAKFLADTDDGWVAMVQHYFASVWILPEGMKRENFVRKLGGELYSAGSISSLGSIASGSQREVDVRLFIGPEEEKMLAGIAPGLELVKDYGMFTILAKPIYWLLDFLHGYLGNWGWAIVALVVLIKAAFYWLNAKAYSSMAKMKALNPRMTALRKRLKDDPKQMQMEVMRMYREEKVNPLGGCLPIVVQIPVFIALYWVILSSVEIRGAPWIGWIHDLSARDPYYILPVFMTLTTLLQTSLNPAPPDPTQAKMMWIMPLAFSVMFFLFPAGLVLYWITNNLLSIAQQAVINTRMGVPPRFHLPDFLLKKKQE